MIIFNLHIFIVQNKVVLIFRKQIVFILISVHYYSGANCHDDLMLRKSDSWIDHIDNFIKVVAICFL